MKRVRIATRGSALALWQAKYARDALRKQEPELEVELIVIKTTGDQILDRPLSEIGGKALFVKEIEQALLEGAADIAVHSMKDVPTSLAPGLRIAAVSAREDPRDALCCRSEQVFSDLPPGARIGTSSLRRACQLLAIRPDLEIVPLRGNVPTRLQKLDNGQYDAIILASAGLVRLGMGARISERLALDVCLPAVGQGALGLETRADDDEMGQRAHRALHDEEVAACVAAERGYLRALEGDCRTPLAAFAVADRGDLALTGLVGARDGGCVIRSQVRGSVDGAEQLGTRLAATVLSKGARELLDGRSHV